MVKIVNLLSDVVEFPLADLRVTVFNLSLFFFKSIYNDLFANFFFRKRNKIWGSDFSLESLGLIKKKKKKKKNQFKLQMFETNVFAISSADY